MKTEQLTLHQFVTKNELEQKPGEDFILYLERVKTHPDFLKLFVKKKKDEK